MERLTEPSQPPRDAGRGGPSPNIRGGPSPGIRGSPSPSISQQLESQEQPALHTVHELYSSELPEFVRLDASISDAAANESSWEQAETLSLLQQKSSLSRSKPSSKADGIPFLGVTPDLCPWSAEDLEVLCASVADAKRRTSERMKASLQHRVQSRAQSRAESKPHPSDDPNYVPAVFPFPEPIPHGPPERPPPKSARPRRVTPSPRPGARSPGFSFQASGSRPQSVLSSAPSAASDENPGRLRKTMISSKEFIEANKRKANRWMEELTPKVFLLEQEKEVWVQVKSQRKKTVHTHAEVLRTMPCTPFDEWFDEVKEAENHGLYFADQLAPMPKASKEASRTSETPGASVGRAYLQRMSQRSRVACAQDEHRHRGWIGHEYLHQINESHADGYHHSGGRDSYQRRSFGSSASAGFSRASSISRHRDSYGMKRASYGGGDH
eukprot:gnl/TRDRNA2_/TRDRNA2_187426_c0_seq1.p1 gnl/TRDRNA2_/TRDRNA2_187426_c0~~gnl/TRDRNA2_/TRDRNA2_187426_c0_seq1.p1  ORF type:complete len:440 (+),score=62.75 gnl/TRDRNA2_/TRDRNA2_187426_c0_seq1:64-1383(+)